MRRYTKLALWGAGVLIAVLVVSFIAFWNFDWNRAKPWLSARVSEATGRQFTMGGDLGLTWEEPPEPQAGWRRLVPWPHLAAQGVRLGNPGGFKAAPNFAEVGRIDFTLNPWLLLERKIEIAGLRLDDAQLELERLAGGNNNWTFQPSAPSAWQLNIKSLILRKGQVHVADAVKHADLKFDVHSLNQDRHDGYGVAWKMQGSFNHLAASGTGQAGSLLSLEANNAVYPIETEMRFGKTSIAVKGTVTHPRSLAALDMRLKFSGVSMAQLYPLIGVVLPDTPPFATEGHLTARLDQSGGDWVYEKFRGTVGSSDLSGTLEFASLKPRPLLKGELVSNVLQFADLAPLIGGDSNNSKVNRGAAPVQPEGKVLPAEAFKSERWTAIDADVKFTGRRILRDQALPIDNLVTDVHLKDGVLALAPLDFGIAGGHLRSNIKLDARHPALKADMQMSARHFQLHELFPTFKSMHASLGEINGDASLSGTGNSVSAMLGSSNGEVRSTIHDATISKLLLEEIGLNLGNVVLTQLTGDKQVKLNCMVSDFTVAGGQMQTRTLVFDTDTSVVVADGRIDLARERLDLTLRPRSKGLRLVSLTAPLHLTGDFKAPQVSVDKGVVALKGAGAVAMAVLTPLAALLPITNLGKKEDGDCANLLAAVRSQPALAPPKGSGLPLAAK